MTVSSVPLAAHLGPALHLGAVPNLGAATYWSESVFSVVVALVFLAAVASTAVLADVFRKRRRRSSAPHPPGDRESTPANECPGTGKEPGVS